MNFKPAPTLHQTLCSSPMNTHLECLFLNTVRSRQAGRKTEGQEQRDTGRGGGEGVSECRCTQGGQRGIGSPGVTGSCEQPNLDARNKTKVPWTSTQSMLFTSGPFL